jgi:hypothetical protein
MKESGSNHAGDITSMAHKNGFDMIETRFRQLSGICEAIILERLESANFVDLTFSRIARLITRDGCIFICYVWIVNLSVYIIKRDISPNCRRIT